MGYKIYNYIDGMCVEHMKNLETKNIKQDYCWNVYSIFYMKDFKDT